MLFLPAYAGTILVVSWANLGGMASQQAEFALGTADFAVSTDRPDTILSTLPSGSRVAVSISGQTVVKTADGLAAYPYESTDATDPVNRGRYVLRAGRFPEASAEVAFTTSMADASGIGLHDSVEVGIPLRRVTVVGLLDVSSSLSAKEIITAAQTPLSDATARRLLIDLPIDRANWVPPRTGGISTINRKDLAPTMEQLAIQAAALTIVASFAGAQIVALTGAAFMMIARRQQRQIRMTSAIGASARQMRRIVLANGVLLSACAAVIGVALGLATFLLAGPVIEKVADHPLIDVTIPSWQVVAVAAVVVVAGLVAAYIPARGVGRQRTPRAHLGTHPRLGGVETLLLVCGLAALTLGASAVFYSANPDGLPELLAAGSIALLAGLMGITPAVLRRGGPVLAHHLTLSGRLALRHAARHYLRTASAVAAVTAAVAGSVALTLVAGARGETTPTPLQGRPGLVFISPAADQVLQPDGLHQLAATLPARRVAELDEITPFPDGSSVTVEAPFASSPTADANAIAAATQRQIAVGGPEMISVIAGRDPSTQEIETLRRGGAVAFNDTLVTGNHVVLLRNTGGKRMELPAVTAERGTYYTALPGLVIEPDTAKSLGLTASPQGMLIDTSRAPTKAEWSRAQSLLLERQLEKTKAPSTPLSLTAYTEPSASVARTSGMFYILVAVSVLVTMTACLVAVGLSSAEMKGDLSTMRAVGAAPRTSRHIRVAQAALIVGAGALLGLLAGIGPAAGYVAYNVTLSWRTPWLMLALVLGVPTALATTAAMAGSRRAGNLSTRRPD